MGNKDDLFDSTLRHIHTVKILLEKDKKNEKKNDPYNVDPYMILFLLYIIGEYGVHIT